MLDSSRVVKVLIIDDDAVDRECIARALRASGQAVDIRVAADGAEGLRCFKEEPPECVFLDHALPDQDGLEFLRVLGPGCVPPVICVTGSADEGLPIKLMENGALEYISKAEITPLLLKRAMAYAMARHQFSQAELDIEHRKAQLSSELLAHVSHELRSPLNAIYQNLSVLRDGIAGELGEKQREFMEIAWRNVLQLRGLITQLLVATRLEVGKLTVRCVIVSVSDVVDEVLASVARDAESKRIVLHSSITEDLPPAYADHGRLVQVLTNLVGNALKFTPCGGGVEILATESRTDPEFLQISVRDTGPGVSEEMREVIFERLRQEGVGVPGHVQGLGLGLYISREIVTRHGGELHVTGRPGGGADFCFTVPIFSMIGQIRGLLNSARALPTAVSLVEVAYGFDSGADNETRRATERSAVWDAIEECVVCDLDLQLPQVISHPTKEFFFVAACGDAAQVAPLVSRLKVHLGGALHQAGEGGGISVSVTTCDLTEGTPFNFEKTACEIAEQVQAIVDARRNEEESNVR